MNRTKKLIAMICLVSVVAAIFCGCSLAQRKNFDIRYSPEAIEAFLESVFKNMKAQNAKVLDPDYDGPASGDCYTAEMEVKLPDKVEEIIQMRFYNKDDSDKVSWGQIIIHDDDSENELNCKIELIYALEKTLSGKVMAEEWMSSPRDIRHYGASTEFNVNTIFAKYMLTDNLQVTISGRGSFGKEWYVFYRIDNTDDLR